MAQFENSTTGDNSTEQDNELPDVTTLFVYKEELPHFEHLGPVWRRTDHDPKNGTEASEWIRAALVKELPERMMESYIGGATGSGLHTGYDTAKLYGDILAEIIDQILTPEK